MSRPRATTGYGAVTTGRALFGFAASPHSAKRELLPPRVPLYRIRKNGQDLEVQPPPTPERKLALLGTRACELAAIGITDKVLFSALGRSPVPGLRHETGRARLASNPPGRARCAQFFSSVTPGASWASSGS